MINIVDKEECCGCHSCYAICPLHCIDMIYDREGFIYPKINNNICINCGTCERACPVICNPSIGEYTKAFAAWSKNDLNRENSSSGGVFGELMKQTIIQNGIIFGAAFDESMKLCHQSARSENEGEKFRGSKYLQSIIGNVYSDVKLCLTEGQKVLFSGTPCQIAGLYSYLGKDDENLLTCDLVCHGVPSQKVFFAYKRYLENKYKGKIIKINFRYKDSGWKKFFLLILFDNGLEYKKVFFDDPFMKGFLENIYLRPSCHDCPFSRIPRVADISLGDFWGVGDHHPEWDDDKGTSLIIVQTQKGQNAIDACHYELTLFETDLSVAVKSNHCISGSVSPNCFRSSFFFDLELLSFDKIIKKYMPSRSLITKSFDQLKRAVVFLISFMR
jgi:coenzyme F420-reducing hydrogenase beta subunit